MCIVSFAWQAHPQWALIAIGNRDEMHARPAEALSRWDQPSHLLAGRDSQAGGTWLGVSEQGRLAVVTNLSSGEAPDPHRASRGDLLKDFLSGEGRYSDLDTVDFSTFNPFNLISVSAGEATIHSNQPGVGSKPLAPGIHGLSNGPLDNPWPKTWHLNSVLADWIQHDAKDPSALLMPLRDETSFAPSSLFESQDPSEQEPQNSGIFIRSSIYGTRCSTVVAIDNEGRGRAVERRFDPTGHPTGETVLDFTWPV
ncbi:MAG: NRDE family protein [Parasphingorhabdus sp.]|uniref:NRDE family protein n=1 Tax=Parasphingorhabdus sp. TaxID=2709688 RepID=UPI00329757EB